MISLSAPGIKIKLFGLRPRGIPAKAHQQKTNKDPGYHHNACCQMKIIGKNKKGTGIPCPYCKYFIPLPLSAYPDRCFQVGIHEDAPAMLAHDDLFALVDLRLPLRRNSIEAAPAGISGNRYYRQAVPVSFTDLFVGGQ